MNPKKIFSPLAVGLALYATAAIFLLWLQIHFAPLVDVSDGIMHFQIAQQAPQNWKLFFDTWGKPLFTALAALPAQFGFIGMLTFNLLIGGTTVFFGIRLLPSNSKIAWMWPIWLLSAQLYLYTIRGGLTEPLFGLLCVMVLYFAQQQRWKSLAIVLGLSFFSRPESVVLIPFGAIYLLMHRKWRPLLLMGAPFVVISLMGWPWHKSFFWYITEQTYVGAADIYGSGAWNHFLKNLPEIYGWPLLIGGGLAFSVILWKNIQPSQNKPEAQQLYLWLAVLPTLGILLLHSYLWWAGAKGSLGLLRVMATTIPLVAAAVFYVVHHWQRHFPRLVLVGFVMASAVVAGLELEHYYAHRKSLITPHPHQKQPELVGAWLSAHQKSSKVAFLHPLVGYYGNLNPHDTARAMWIWDLKRKEPLMGLRYGDYLVWDAPHTPNEGNLQLEDLLQHPHFEPVAYFPPAENLMTLGDRPLDFYIFKVVPQARRMQSEILAQQNLYANAPQRFDAAEFIHIPVELQWPKDKNYLYIDVLWEGTAHHTGAQKIYAVMQQDYAAGLRLYRIAEVDQGTDGALQKFEVKGRITPATQDFPLKIYIWNPQGAQVQLQDLKFETRRIFTAAADAPAEMDSILQAH